MRWKTDEQMTKFIKGSITVVKTKMIYWCGET